MFLRTIKGYDVMNRLVVGILAHVDAGKTTLSENMLYLSGEIRKLGRVDNRDAFLDTYDLERSRGITIFSKQAVMTFGDTEVTLLDTPGHVDFSAEMERTLQVLDYAILVISGADGVQSHTRTLWELLKIYDIPTFIFVNKMDQSGTDRETVITSLQKELGDGCIAFDTENEEERNELLALCDEGVMDMYLEKSTIEESAIFPLIENRKTFPIYFGSALRQLGTEAFIKGFINYTRPRTYPQDFGAKVFKITRDAQGNRLTHLKITGGHLKVKDIIKIHDQEEKINQIRVYSGEKYKAENMLEAGAVCAVTGLTTTRPGDGIGIEEASNPPRLEPVLSYQVILTDDVDVQQMLPMLREIEEEEPELRVIWNEVLQEINIQVMGAVQLEILESVIMDRFGVTVTFDHGEVVYKETIGNTCEGVGHFEPLRHYAEVHLLLEPGERGSGLEFALDCSEDILDKNWQRLVLTHLKEKAHRGVLTGAHITDMKITLVTGRAHNKHTAGGDFRQATFRALRQGLMEAESVLLEPYYKFRLVLPESMVGRAMTDIGNMEGHCVIDNMDGAVTVLTGDAPVTAMRNYQQEVNAYTKGEGRLSVAIKGYDVCHNPEAVIERIGYDPEQDLSNPADSVFCSKGSGYMVPWDEVKEYMHVESVLKPVKEHIVQENRQKSIVTEEQFISLEEIDSIISSTTGSNNGRKGVWKKKKTAKESHYDSVTYKGSSTAVRNRNAEEYLLVDGYNVIYAWEELEVLAKENLDAARMQLMEILSNYQPIRKSKIMLVFDAYRVKDGKEKVEEYHNIRVVFTGEAQTADHFIEKFAYMHKKDYRITVATSDGMEQMIIRGAGANLLSARELKESIEIAQEMLNREHLTSDANSQNKLEDVLSEEDKKKLLNGK